METNPNPTKNYVEKLNGVPCDQNCYEESVTLVSTTFNAVETLTSQKDNEKMAPVCHEMHKKETVMKSDKGVNTTSDLHDPLLRSKNNTQSSKKFLTVDNIVTKRKLSANLSLETGTVSHRLANAVSMNRLTIVGNESSVATTGEETHAEKMQRIQKEKAKMAQAKERKAARTMAVIVVTFIICWLPFFLMYVILAFVSEEMIPSPKVRSSLSSI